MLVSTSSTRSMLCVVAMLCALSQPPTSSFSVVSSAEYAGSYVNSVQRLEGLFPVLEGKSCSEIGCPVPPGS